MAASAAILPPAGPSQPRRITRLGVDRIRIQQRARFQNLRTRQFDECRSAGRIAWAEAKRIQANLPLELEGENGELHPVRVDVPSPDVFALVLGVFRAGATLKEGKGDGKILELELSVADIAELIGRSKSTVEAVLRLLSCAHVEYKGVDYGRALGIVHRRLRYGRAYLDGVLRWVHRTSSIVLTLAGRALLGLAERSQERKRARRKAEVNSRPTPPVANRSDTLPVADAPAAALRAHQDTVDDEGPAARAAAEAARASIRRQLNLN